MSQDDSLKKIERFPVGSRIKGSRDEQSGIP